jgi:energy-coupling factor transporter transmembrane protein EcfT
MYFAISDDAVFGLQWQTVNVGIIFYVITAHLYQQCLAEMRNHQQHSTKIVTAASASTILSVFPDGVTLIAMLLVCLREIAMAYLFLIACLVILASIVMGSSIYLLLYVTDADDENNNNNNNNNNELEIKQQQQQYKFPETPVIRHSMVTFQL